MDDDQPSNIDNTMQQCMGGIEAMRKPKAKFARNPNPTCHELSKCSPQKRARVRQVAWLADNSALSREHGFNAIKEFVPMEVQNWYPSDMERAWRLRECRHSGNRICQHLCHNGAGIVDSRPAPDGAAGCQIRPQRQCSRNHVRRKRRLRRRFLSATEDH